MNGQVNPGTSSSDADKKVRDRSSVEFTYNGLDDCEELTNAIRSVGGTGCSLDALAAKMDQSATGGGFRMKVYSTRTFGLCDVSKGHIELTALGLRIIDSSHVKQARVEAFLNVPLYRQMYEQLKGQPLPPMAAIERMMLNAGVAPKQKERARQVFIRSAKHAGFFDIHSDRLVKPQSRSEVGSGGKSGENEPTAAEQLGAPPPPPRIIYGGGGSGGGGEGIPDAILGLLRLLPAEGTEMTVRRREQLIAAFSSAIAFLYPEPGEGST
ncbi:hypothetical protein [Pseudoxanthomonas sp.]|uniref:hypothetical protein n=1 Tax=Pseudoxanthomonas sp. TaxID=1871049 RepID=UPI003F7F4F32